MYVINHDLILKTRMILCFPQSIEKVIFLKRGSRKDILDDHHLKPCQKQKPQNPRNKKHACLKLQIMNGLIVG